MGMNWSRQQEQALVAASRWLREGRQQVFRLFGYAGTGKTTLARELAATTPGRVIFAAYTGKAALVMRQRGCLNASTIHSIIYKPANRSTKLLNEMEEQLAALLKSGIPETDPRIKQLQASVQAEREHVTRPSFVLNPESELHHASLIVIDECSMVDERMGRDLLSFEKPILVLGDPAQLPPVRGEGFFTNQQPDIMLTEIHRHARDNPIIQLASTVREGGTLRIGGYGNCRVGAGSEFSKQMAQEADQVIVGRNVTRREFNLNFRKHVLGFTNNYPCAGDKLVCLRNNHEIGLLNGGLWSVVEVQPPGDTTMSIRIRPSDVPEASPIDVSIHTAPFCGEETPWWARRDAEEFEYGYALTCHKAQGSQWGNVLIFDESYSFREHARNWLYTAITRAVNRVTILK